MGLQALLQFPEVYSAFRRCVERKRRNVYVTDYVRPAPGMRILDLGCGPGDFLARLPPDVDYVGIDLSEKYIAEAKKCFGQRGTFLAGSVADRAVTDLVRVHCFDLVTFNGVLHHLNDDEVRSALGLAQRAVKLDGRIVTLDGCFVPGQSALARLMLHWDRGRHVRDLEGYRALLSEFFADVETVVLHDLIRIPYTHLIATARRPRVLAGKGAN